VTQEPRALFLVSIDEIKGLPLTSEATKA